MTKNNSAKAKYVDGFVFVVKDKNVAAYKKMAAEGKRMWMKAGALEYKECKGQDLVVKPMGGMKYKGFAALAGAKKGETVWFSFITFKNKKHRDAVNAVVMKAMDKKYANQKAMPMPFDMERMSYGGFSVEVG